ncbi:phosphoadenylyl-sulfate reductase [Microbaculum marinum]|uniref:Adenosine 5'-phosphosulfate reductase n=1 Tax=Microbaculum marinum TaxID=1764581 RepID=A0AAW9RYA5_9HYPH
MGNEVVCTKESWPDPAVLDRLFTGASAQDLITYTLKELAPGRTSVVSSFGADSAVLLHLVSRIAPDTPVIFLETGKHFPETLAYREELVERLGLTDVRIARPEPARLRALDPGGNLFDRNSDLCCAIRKEEPLEKALSGFGVWLTGRRRHQTAEREAMPLVERDGRRLKVNPLADWDTGDVSAYRTIHELPRHPLVEFGYLSIGCAPCTSPVAENEDVRAGRWRGSDKAECGIHITRSGETVRIIPAGEQ